MFSERGGWGGRVDVSVPMLSSLCVVVVVDGNGNGCGCSCGCGCDDEEGGYEA